MDIRRLFSACYDPGVDLAILSAIGSAVLLAMHGVAIVTLLAYEQREPTATLAWLLSLIFLPVLGLLLYLMIGRTRAHRVAKKYAVVVAKLRQVIEKYRVYHKLEEAGDAATNPQIASLVSLGDRLASTPASRGNQVRILVDAKAAYHAMEAAIRSAQHHVHVDFYIIQPDVTGRRLRELLVERAREGVQVRLVCDGVGSGRLPKDFWAPLIAAGGEATVFRPVMRLLARLPLRDRFDFRNHRKLLIVDGRIGFTGGINVGREYLGLDPEVGYWRDTHVQIAGPAVLSLQKVFAEDWLHAAEQLLDDESYFPTPASDSRGPFSVHIIDSGPDRSVSPISYLFTQAFALANQRIWVTSPYFIPSPAIQMALISAALRGVDVRLLVPMRPDHRLVMLAAISYFQPLLEVGVRIFRYERGFVHAKTMVVDDWVGTIGSANMDMRSFHLNYELNAFVYGAEFCEQLAEQYLADLEHASEMSLDQELRTGLVARLIRAGARMASPLL